MGDLDAGFEALDASFEAFLRKLKQTVATSRLLKRVKDQEP
jgi:hypothetical protein